METKRKNQQTSFWFSPIIAGAASALGMAIVVLFAYYVDLERWRVQARETQEGILNAIVSIEENNKSLSNEFRKFVVTQAQNTGILQSQVSSTERILVQLSKLEERYVAELKEIRDRCNRMEQKMGDVEDRLGRVEKR